MNNNKSFLAVALAVLFLSTTTLAEEPPLRVAKLIPSDSGEQAPADTWAVLDPGLLALRSESALIVDGAGSWVYAKNVDDPRPIASITKLMTAMVVLDSDLSLDTPVSITKDDRDLIKLTGSRLPVGSELSREEMLRLALLASDNRVANALARSHPGGREAFIAAMNEKAQAIGMTASRFADPAGLDPANVASARDVLTMVKAAREYPLIVEATTTRTMVVYPLAGRGPLRFGNTNRLLGRGSWEIALSKTGYINESGRCLVMQAEIADRPLYIVLLDSFGKLTPMGDSNRLRRWIEGGIGG